MVDSYRLSPKDEEDRKFDQFVHAVTGIDHVHRMGHDGFAYHTSGKFTGLANGASVDHIISVPASIHPHIQFIKISVGDGDIDVVTYEGVTTSDDGTAMSILNTNRNSSNAAGTTVFSAGTVTDLGTKIHTRWRPTTATGAGARIGTLVEEPGEEWIFKPSTKYTVRITNNSGGSITYTFEMLWYEVGYDV